MQYNMNKNSPLESSTPTLIRKHQKPVLLFHIGS